MSLCSKGPKRHSSRKYSSPDPVQSGVQSRHLFFSRRHGQGRRGGGEGFLLEQRGGATCSTPQRNPQEVPAGPAEMEACHSVSPDCLRGALPACRSRGLGLLPPCRLRISWVSALTRSTWLLRWSPSRLAPVFPVFVRRQGSAPGHTRTDEPTHGRRESLNCGAAVRDGVHVSWHVAAELDVHPFGIRGTLPPTVPSDGRESRPVDRSGSSGSADVAACDAI